MGLVQTSLAGSTLRQQGCANGCMRAIRDDIASRSVVSGQVVGPDPTTGHAKALYWADVTRLLVGGVRYIKGVSCCHFVMQRLRVHILLWGYGGELKN